MKIDDSACTIVFVDSHSSLTILDDYNLLRQSGGQQIIVKTPEKPIADSYHRGIVFTWVRLPSRF